MKNKKVLGYDGALGKVSIKESSGFIEDVSFGEFVQPALINVSDQDAWKLYEGNEWIFSVINRITHDCVKVKPKIVPKDRSRKVEGRLKQRVDILREFFENPNGNKEGFFEIREKVIRDLLVFGRASIEKVILAGSRKLKEIYAQSPKYVYVQADEHGNLPVKDTYVQKPPHSSKKGEVKYDIDEMIFMVLLPTSGTMYGLKIIDAIANSVAADILRAAYNHKFFVNGAEAGGILGLEGMSKTELKKFRAYWKENFKGANKAHKTAVVNVPLKYVRMALTNRDLQFKEYGAELRTKIFSAYGMQPFIMGIVDATTGKLNSGQQVDSYKDGALRPILTREEYYYTEEIIKRGFGFSDIVIEFPDIDLADVEKQTEIDRKDIEAGILIINEVRRRRGLSDVPWGNTPVSLAPGGGQVDPTTGQIIPPSSQPTNGQPAKKPIPKKTVLDKFVTSSIIKLSAILDNLEEDVKMLPKISIQEYFKEKQIFVNGKEFKIKMYHVPYELKNSNLWKSLEIALNFDYICSKDDVRYLYLESISSKIKYLFFAAALKGNLNNLISEIDRYIYEEKKSDIFCEMF